MWEFVTRWYFLEPLFLYLMQVLPITVAFCAFVAFNNLSLQYNGVSFYQLMKILTTPAVVVLQLVFFKVRDSHLLTLRSGKGEKVLPRAWFRNTPTTSTHADHKPLNLSQVAVPYSPAATKTPSI